MTTGLFPLSGDPLHYGHLDIIKRAAEQCDRLVVALLVNDFKSYCFEMGERLQIARRAVQMFVPQDKCRIDVISSEDLLVDVFLREGCSILFRGVRTAEDMEFEKQQMELHEYALPGILGNVRYLEADPKYRVISSTAIKTMLQYSVDVSTMCPLFVKSKLERRRFNRYIFGVTGGMGSGKSYVSAKLVDAFKARGIPAHHLNLDDCIRASMNEDSPGAQQMRAAIEAHVGVSIPLVNGVADMAAYKAAIASGAVDIGVRQTLHNITEPHVMRHLRYAMRGKHGVLLFEWALMAENDLSHICNHDVIVVSSPDQDAFLTERGVDPALAAALRSNQWSDGDKANAIRRRVAQDQCGLVIEYPNPRGAEPTGLADSLIGLFPGLEAVR